MPPRPPFLGTEDGSEVTAPWDSPLRTFQIHQSHIETLTAMCAKRFEFEFARLPNPDRKSGSGSIAMGLGSASHMLVNGIVEGSISHSNLIQESDKLFNQYVLPWIQDPGDLRQTEADFKRNSSVALFWISEELKTNILHSEKPFLIHRAADLVSGIPDKYSLGGRIDLVELDEEEMTANIIDMKFRLKPSPQKNLASSQSLMYSLATQFYGFKPSFTFLEIVKGRPYEQKIEINQGSIEFFEEKIRDSVNMMESGVFPINVGGWWCSSRYCRFWSECRGKYETQIDP